MRSTVGCAVRAGPAAAPGTAFRTPGGSTSLASSASRSTVSGACSPGLTITVLPAAGAGAPLLVKLIRGQLEGRGEATAPEGPDQALASIRAWSMISPCRV